MFDDEKLEGMLEGIMIRTEVTETTATVEYIPVKNSKFYIDVWNCVPRFAMRSHIGKGQMKTETIELKNEKAQELFKKLVQIRDVIINLSGHYFIETDQQKRLLDEIVIAEGLFACRHIEDCDSFLDTGCPLEEGCPEYQKPFELFTAKWCGPCQTIKTFLSDTQKERIEFVDIDTEEGKLRAEAYNIHSIPAIFYLKKQISISNLREQIKTNGEANE